MPVIGGFYYFILCLVYGSAGGSRRSLGFAYVYPHLRGCFWY